jgi:hypothetical protein
MKYLLIDGDYLAHRMVNSLVMDNIEVTLDDTVEMHNFKINLYNAVISIYQSLNNENQRNLIDDVIVVFDNKSWRKSLPIYRPYYIDELDTTPLGYKDNRKEAKEKSALNYENFNICMRDVENMLKETQCKVICSDGAEGDDILMLLVDKLYKENMLLLYATDGDLKYLIRDNVVYFRNIYSKVSREGEFVISDTLYENLYGKRDMLSMFTQNMSKTAGLKDYFDKLFSVKFSTFGKERAERLVDISILKTSKYTNLFIKSVCGDKKDNIFSTLRWINGTGTMFNSVTENMVIKAMKVVFPKLIYSENVIFDLFFNETEKNIKINLELLYRQLLISTKQNTKTTIKESIIHYERNLKMNQLESKNLPPFVVENFNDIFEKIIVLPTFKQINPKMKAKIDKFKQQAILNILG